MAFGNSFNGGVSSGGGGGGSDITASQITDASSNGRSLITAANYAAMRVLLDVVQNGSETVSASEITDASSNGRSLITAADYAAMRALLGVQIQPTKITKSVDESRTSTTTTTTDAALVFPVDANSVYEFEYIFTVNGTLAAGGFRIALLLPASASAMITGRTTANTTQHNASNTAAISAVISAAQMLATQECWFTGRVRTLGTAGNVALAWAQNASSVSPVTIAAGATVSYRKL